MRRWKISLGCSISQASASVMSDLVIGKPVSEAMRIGDEFLELMKSKGQLEPDEDVRDAAASCPSEAISLVDADTGQPVDLD